MKLNISDHLLEEDHPRDDVHAVDLQSDVGDIADPVLALQDEISDKYKKTFTHRL